MKPELSRAQAFWAALLFGAVGTFFIADAQLGRAFDLAGWFLCICLYSYRIFREPDSALPRLTPAPRIEPLNSHPPYITAPEDGNEGASDADFEAAEAALNAPPPDERPGRGGAQSGPG